MSMCTGCTSHRKIQQIEIEDMEVTKVAAGDARVLAGLRSVYYAILCDVDVDAHPSSHGKIWYNK